MNMMRGFVKSLAAVAASQIVYSDASYYRDTGRPPPVMPLRASIAIDFAKDKCWRLIVRRSYPMVLIDAINIDPDQESVLTEHGFSRIKVLHAGGPKRSGARIHMRYETGVRA